MPKVKPMDLATAKAQGVLATTIEQIVDVINRLDTAIEERWLITTMIVSAPPTGGSSPEGTTLSVLIPGQSATPENSTLALTTARATYQAKLDALNAQLAGG